MFKSTYMFLSSKQDGNGAPKLYEVHSWPTKVIIGPDGKIASMSGQLGGEIDDLLKQVKPEDLRKGAGSTATLPAGDYGASFEELVKTFRAGDYKAIAGDLSKLEKASGKDGENAKAISKAIAELGDAMLKGGEEAEKDGDALSARDAYQDVEKRWAPASPQGKSAKEKLAALKKDKDLGKVLSQEKALRDAAALKEKDKAKAAAALTKIADALGSTKFADRLRERAKALGGKSPS